MSLADAFAPIEQANYNIVMANTFGHLASNGKEFFGTILAAHTEYGEFVIIKSDFPGMDCSPWQFDHFNDFVYDKLKDMPVGIYRFNGKYRVFLNGNCRFSHGKFQRIEV